MTIRKGATYNSSC